MPTADHRRVRAAIALLKKNGDTALISDVWRIVKTDWGFLIERLDGETAQWTAAFASFCRHPSEGVFISGYYGVGEENRRMMNAVSDVLDLRTLSGKKIQEPFKLGGRRVIYVVPFDEEDDLPPPKKKGTP